MVFHSIGQSAGLPNKNPELLSTMFKYSSFDYSKTLFLILCMLPKNLERQRFNVQRYFR